MSAAETILSPEAVTGAHGSSLQRLVGPPFVRVERGDSRTVLPTLDAASVQCCVTSPPYWGLRDYGHADQIGQEDTPDEYVQSMVSLFREVRRVLAKPSSHWAARNANKNAAGFDTSAGAALSPPQGGAAGKE